MKRLNEISDIIMGQSPASSTYNTIGEGVPFFQGNADFGIEHPNVRVYCSLPTKMSEKGDVLISVRAPIGAVNIANQTCCIGRGLAAVRPLEGKSQTRYLYHLLIANKEVLESKGTGSTFKAITGKVLNDVHVPSYNMEQQKEIARLLDTVVAAITKRRKQIDFYNDLVKSQFIEMFGDPITNSQNRPTKPFIDIVKLQRGFDLPVQDRIEGSIPVYGSNGVLSYHNDAKSEDGVITGRSGTIGKVYFCRGKFWPLNTTLYSVDKHGNNPVFLATLLRYFDLARFFNGTGVPTLNRNIVHKERVIDVPRDEQDQFARFVEQTDKSKIPYEMEVAA